MLYFDDNGTIDDAPLPFSLFNCTPCVFSPSFSSPAFLLSCVTFFFTAFPYIPLPSLLSLSPCVYSSGSHEYNESSLDPAYFSKVDQDDKRLMLTTCFLFLMEYYFVQPFLRRKERKKQTVEKKKKKKKGNLST
ncbi:hypothetical protein BKA57DRAFT_108326 [Linnemannia elongata]|nr:hypothetical protein BKA57DRAFT_108326 [Linnemannia elongata]